jgi:anti-sigma regulatory factor (Ser/Thr protein kinase)
VPAEAGYLAVCRQALAGVGAGLGIAQRPLEDLKLALSEACGNAIQHAYRGAAGTLDVTFRALPDELEISVADRGSGFVPSSKRGGRRLGIGLSMIAALSTRWKVESHPQGGTVLTFARALRS